MANNQFKYNLAQAVAAPQMRLLGRVESKLFDDNCVRYYLYLDGGMAQLTVVRPSKRNAYAWIDAYDSGARQVAWTRDVKYDAQLINHLDHIFAGRAAAGIRPDIVWEVYHDLSEVTVLDALWRDEASYYYVGTSGQRVHALIVGARETDTSNHVVMRNGLSAVTRHNLSAAEAQILRPLMRNVLAQHTK